MSASKRATMPAMAITLEERIVMTCSCEDANSIPKVSNAGAIELDENGHRVQVMHNGLKVVADGYCGEWMSRIITSLKGHHEPQEEVVFDAILSQVKSSAVMLEIGSYWAYYSLWFLKDHANTRRAFGVEPDPAHIEVGKRNCHLNDLNIIFEQGYVSESEGEKTLFQTEDSGELELESISVNGLLDRHHIDYADLILCDAQGGETSFLNSLDELVSGRGRIGVVIISTHAFQITGSPLTHQYCLEIIQRMGGKILLEHDVHESYSGDGLIVANFGREHIVLNQDIISRNRYSTSLFRNPLWDLQVEMSEKDLCAKSWLLQKR